MTASLSKFARVRLSHGWWSTLVLLLGLSVGQWPDRALGLGTRIPNQDAEAIGRGNAFVATADNPAALYYNPAGITQLEGQNVQVGSLFYLNIYADYVSPGGQKFENKHEIVPVPNVDYVFTPKDQPFSFGLGVHAPFGLGMEWPDDAPFRNNGLKAELTYITISPVIAWKPFSTLSIAAGPTFNYSEAELVQGVIMSPLQFRFKGHDWAYGFNAGALWQPHPMWSFGAKYFSATTMAYDGSASFEPNPGFLPTPFPTKTHLKFPQIVVVGVSFRPTPDWNIEFDADWADWDQVKDLRIDNVATTPLNWESSFFYEFGVTRQLGKGYYASIGYFFSQASTPSQYYTPLVPDTDLHVGTLGFGYKGQHWSWAVAGELIGGDYRNVQSTVNPSVNGKYRLFTPTLAISLGYRF